MKTFFCTFCYFLALAVLPWITIPVTLLWLGATWNKD
jgi:hypothetical protein